MGHFPDLPATRYDSQKKPCTTSCAHGVQTLPSNTLMIDGRQIVVTGADGQLGAELCRQFGATAIGLDLPEFDLRNGGAVRKRLREIGPQAIINAAAYTHVDRAEMEPDLCRAVNVNGVACLTQACRELNCPLVQLSTDYVFGGADGRKLPFCETDQPSPRGVYAQTKCEAEQQVARWKKSVIVRTCGLYGPAATRSSGDFVATMLRLTNARTRLRVVADQRCTPSYTPHVARAIRFLLTTDAYGVYHVVNCGDTTWFDFASEIFRLAGLTIELKPINTHQWRAPAPRPAYSVLDNSKYHRLVGAPGLPHWKEALKEHFARS